MKSVWVTRRRFPSAVVYLGTVLSPTAVAVLSPTAVAVIGRQHSLALLITGDRALLIFNSTGRRSVSFCLSKKKKDDTCFFKWVKIPKILK